MIESEEYRVFNNHFKGAVDMEETRLMEEQYARDGGCVLLWNKGKFVVSG